MGSHRAFVSCQRQLTRKQALYGRAAHLTVLTLWFLDKSNASSFASAASRLPDEKLMSVCSGWMPQRVMICGISEATDRMASAPSPSELLSRLRWGKARCQGALTRRRTLLGGGALERGHSASLEPLAQRNDDLSGGKELVILVVIPTKVVALQTASAGKEAAW